MGQPAFFDQLGRRALFAYLAVWALAVTYLGSRGGDWTFPIASLLIFGVTLSGLIWFLTRRMDAPPVPVANPRWESFGLLAYVFIYAVVLIGILLGSIKHMIPPGPSQEIAVVAYKLLIHIALPAAVIVTLGGALRPLLDGGFKRRGFWSTLLVLSAAMFGLLAVVSPALQQISSLKLDIAGALALIVASWGWYSLEAGLCEEFLFRACLQSRLTALFRSPMTAIVVTSLLFGLAHWPGLYLRGGPGVDGWSTDPFQVAAFTVATLSPLSLSLGLLWSRSRSLLLIVLVHGAIDALPNAAELFKIWI